jgi:hypothetical protein
LTFSLVEPYGAVAAGPASVVAAAQGTRQVASGQVKKFNRVAEVNRLHFVEMQLRRRVRWKATAVGHRWSDIQRRRNRRCGCIAAG